MKTKGKIRSEHIKMTTLTLVNYDVTPTVERGCKQRRRHFDYLS